MRDFSVENARQRLQNAGFQKRKLAAYTVPAIFADAMSDVELMPLSDKSRASGILLFESAETVRAAQFEIKKIKSTGAGQRKPMVCDFCYTLRPGGQIGMICFVLDRQKTRMLSHYVCADLACSLHVRGLTDALVYAKTQIREDISTPDRIARLHTKTSAIFDNNASVVVPPAD